MSNEGDRLVILLVTTKVSAQQNLKWRAGQINVTYAITFVKSFRKVSSGTEKFRKVASSAGNACLRLNATGSNY